MKQNDGKKHNKKKNSIQVIAKRLSLILVVIVLVIGIGAFSIFRKTSDNPDGGNSNIEVFTVTRSDLTISVTETGDIKALNSTNLNSKVEGTTTIISIVDEGTFITPEDVNSGKILCELDSSAIKEKLTQQEITYLNAEASLTEATEALDIRKKQNESDIETGQIKVAFALMDLKKYLGEIVTKNVIEDTNGHSSLSIDITACLKDTDLGGEAAQKLKELEDKINLADSRLKRATGLLEGSQKLYDANYIAKTELEADQLNVQSLKFQKESAQIALQLFKLYEFSKEARKLLNNYYEARRELERTQARARSKLAQANAGFESKKATYSLQKKRLKKFQEQFEACFIKAPTTGEVVYSSSLLDLWQRRRKMIAIGETVRERQKIISIPDTSEMKVEIKVNETWIGKIQLEQKAKITVSAFPDKSFTGMILRKAPMADPMRWWNPGLKVYTTDVSIDGTHDSFKTGMSAKVEVIIEQLKNVLSVPIQAVINHEGKKICFVVTEKGTRQREVKTGLHNDNFVQIRNGLAEGEKVLLNPPILVDSEQIKE
jgi:RND family efflux transporter MFP subunit